MVVEYKDYNNSITNESSEVIVTIKFAGEIIQFPINPEVLKNEIESNSLSEKVEGLGEISIPQTPSLSTMSFTSFFPDSNNNKPSLYVNWIKNWQSSKKPARLIVSGLNWDGWDMDVTCEAFSYWTSAGEEGDIYFNISLKQYRAYEARNVKLLNNQFILDDDGMATVLADYDYSLYYEANSGIVNRIDNKEVPESVTIGNGESITSLVERYSMTNLAPPKPKNNDEIEANLGLKYDAWTNTYSFKGADFYELNKAELAETLTKQMDAAIDTNAFVSESMKLTNWYNITKRDSEELIRLLSGT